MGKDNIFLGMIVLFFIAFMELDRMIFSLKGISFGIELLLFFALLFVTLIISLGLYFETSWAFPGCIILFVAMFLNALFFYSKSTALLTTNLHALTLVFGFLVALINLGTYGNSEEDFYEDEVVAYDEPKSVEVVKEEPVKTTFSPGKFVASKTGKKYHSPKCDWAKKISNKNRKWLKDAKEAKAKGYKPCKCTK